MPTIKRKKLLLAIVLGLVGLGSFSVVSSTVAGLDLNIFFKTYVWMMVFQTGGAIAVLSYLRWGNR